MATIKGRLLTLAACGVGGFLAGRALVRRSQIDYSFRGKVVLITGGARGLGLVLSRQLAAEGARLAICARDPDELRRGAIQLAQRGAEVLTVPCDISREDDVNRMVAEIRNHYGRIDVLINNAGVIQAGPMEEMTLEDYEESMQVHLYGPLHLVRAVVPEMRERRQGRIVNISSIGGKISVPHLLPYSASKFALTGFSEGLRAELSKDGICVTTVCPGLMRTGSPRNAHFKGQHRAEYAWFSISDSLPLLSMDADRAARKIIESCRRGDAELVLSFPAKVATLIHGLFPGLTADMLGLVNRLLPGPGGIGTRRAKGSESESMLAPSWLTALTEKAAQRNNETT